MPPRQPLDLTDQQRQELRATLNHHAQPYMRERAGALLKIADGAAAATRSGYGLRLGGPLSSRGFAGFADS